jgi:hypothetical protein
LKPEGVGFLIVVLTKGAFEISYQRSGRVDLRQAKGRYNMMVLINPAPTVEKPLTDAAIKVLEKVSGEVSRHPARETSGKGAATPAAPPVRAAPRKPRPKVANSVRISPSVLPAPESLGPGNSSAQHG